MRCFATRRTDIVAMIAWYGVNVRVMVVADVVRGKMRLRRSAMEEGMGRRVGAPPEGGSGRGNIFESGKLARMAS